MTDNLRNNDCGCKRQKIEETQKEVSEKEFEKAMQNNLENAVEFEKELDDQCGDYDDSDDDELMKKFKKALHEKDPEKTDK